ncbi:Programmed cell death protein 2, C-terminal [Dillenia turbinata]|uniref:Programmed cell death protein 2, C-terminal n=1 Tax=Dillenia turbinata TaxID=194707 RepID=A0AAN8VK23_9MAGN
MSEHILENFKALQKCSLQEEEEEEEEEEIVTEDAEDDEEDDDDEEEEEPTTLRFVEKPKNRWSLLRHLFLSKAGCVPISLKLPLKRGEHLSSDDWFHFPKCRLGWIQSIYHQEGFANVTFVYASISNKDFTFHRTIFVFMCPSMFCLLKDQHGQWQRQPDKALRRKRVVQLQGIEPATDRSKAQKLTLSDSSQLRYQGWSCGSMWESVKVFCCQLPRSNPFYSSEPPRYNGIDKPSGDGADCVTGVVPGKEIRSVVIAEKRTIVQRSTRYLFCLQTRHWHSGHKVACEKMILSSSDSSPCKVTSTSADLPKGKSNASNALWPELEIINEDESEYDLEETTDTKKANSLVPAARVDDTINSLMDTFEGDCDKKSWASFQVCISKAPEQVLRYSRGVRAKPLWPMSSGRPCKADIPKCCYCGGPRIFEFLILPQYYFGVKNDADSLDWATVAVHTCEASCEASIAYKEESVWVQLSSSSASMPCKILIVSL